MEMSHKDKMELLDKMTPREIVEVVEEAQFYGYSTDEYLSSPCAAALRKQVSAR